VKNVIAALLLIVAAGSSVAMANTEIQIFLNYRGFNDYDSKLVSLWERPISAQYLDVVDANGNAVNGACFSGNPYEAIALMQNMSAPAQVWGDVYFDPSTGTQALRLFRRADVFSDAQIWFPRVQRCIRWSTPEERAVCP